MKKSIIKRNLRRHLISGIILADHHGKPVDWYGHARVQVAESAKMLGLPSDYWAGVLAICSAQCSVWESFRRAFNYVTTGRTVGFIQGQCEAYENRYRTTGDSRIIGSDGLPTPKTDAFRDSIDPNGSQLVGDDTPPPVIDRHVFDGSAGHGVFGVEITEERRKLCSEAIVELAEEYSISVSSTQSALWFSVKYDKGDREIGARTAKCPFSLFLVSDYVHESLQFSGVE